MKSYKNVLWAAAVSAAACGVSPQFDSVESQESELSSKTTTSSSLSGLTVTLTKVVAPNGQAKQPAWVLRGQTNRDLTDVKSFVATNELGQATLTTPRSFEIALDPHELHTLLVGTPLFVTFGQQGAKSVTASIKIAPELTGATGSSSLKVNSTITPIFGSGADLFRGKVTTTVTATSFEATLDSSALASVLHPSTRTWTFDWGFDELEPTLETSGEMHFSATRARTTYKTDAQLQVTVTKLALTTSDPTVAWPTPACDPQTQACLNALPPGTTDAATCGSYVEVQACQVSTVLPQLHAQAISADAQKIVDSANNSLVRARVAVSKFFYDWTAAQAPTIDQLTQSLLTTENYPSATVKGAVNFADLKNTLALWQLAQLLPSRSLVYETTPAQVAEIDLPHGAATGASYTPATVYLLVFPNSGTVVAIELGGPTP